MEKSRLVSRIALAAVLVLVTVPLLGTAAMAAGVTDYPVPTLNSQPDDVTAGPDGALWFTEYNGNKIVQVTTSD